MATLQEIEARLTGPGAPFETVEETVLGEPMTVFKTRATSLRALLEQSAAHGEAEYIVFEDRRISYAQHLRHVASVAAALRERFGVGHGDRVAIVAANCPEWIITFWAATSLGAVAVGLNGWWAGEELRYGISDCDPKVVIGDRKRLERLEGHDPGMPVVEIESDFAALLAHAPDAGLPDTPIGEDDPACILYTSGTTGRPKGAVATHRNLVAVLGLQFFHGLRGMMVAAERGLKPPPTPDGKPRRTCALVTTPLFHVSGLYTGAVMMLASGAKTVWRAGRFDPVDVMRLIETEQVTNWGPMGTMAHRVVTHPDVERFDLSSVVGVGSGGAPTPVALLDRMRAVFPNARASMGLGYGLTESGALAAINWGEDLEKHPDSVGRPLPTVQIEIRNAQEQALPEGEEGEICIRSPLVMREYWRNPEATAASIGPGRWLRTGDVGRLVEGRLYINARARDLILRGGENVYPVEIEQRLEAHPDVDEAAVIGVDHEELGQEVKAVVVPRAGKRLDAQALAGWVRQALAAFKVPVHWEIREAPLPRNATGKVLKAVLAGDADNTFVAE